jgi:acetyltransferase-like isoleucine patch superfamily enzyme
MGVAHGTKDVVIHQPAYVAPSAFLGARSIVWYFSQVVDGVVIGEDCVIGSNCFIGFKTRIGARTRIQHGVFLPAHSILGEEVFIGPNVTCTDDKYPRAGNKHYRAEPPVISNRASIGAGAVLLPGVIIGVGSVVGAGAVVTHDVPDGETYIGIPAKLLGPALEPVPVGGGRWRTRGDR